MSNYDPHSFLTQSYKGHFIHSHCEGNRDIVTWQPSDTFESHPVKSIHAAKLAITKYVKEKKDGKL